jgi:hypothetical protein
MKFDLVNGFNPSIALAPLATALNDNTQQVTTTLDLQGSHAATLFLLTGTLADAGAEFVTTLYEGNAANMSDEAAVADADLIGTEELASFNQSADNKAFKLGYKGNKRYIRAKITVTNNASAAPLAGMWLTKTDRAGAAANPPA